MSHNSLFNMTTSNISLEDRLERKRKAARLRQQRCRSRKRKEAQLSIGKPPSKEQMLARTAFLVVNETPSKLNKSHPSTNHDSREPPRIAPKVSFSSPWQPYWGDHSSYQQQESPSFNYTRTAHTDFHSQQYEHSRTATYSCEKPVHRHQSFIYEQRSSSFEQSPPYMRDEYTNGHFQSPLHRRPPLVPMIPAHCNRQTSQDYYKRCEQHDESRSSPDCQSSGRPVFEKREEAAIDAILSLKDSIRKPVARPGLEAKPRINRGQSSFRLFQRPTPPRYNPYQPAHQPAPHQHAHYDQHRQCDPGMYLTMRFT